MANDSAKSRREWLKQAMAASASLAAGAQFGGRALMAAPPTSGEADPDPAARPDAAASPPAMHWADASRGKPYSKDPSVVRFRGRALMYFSIPPRAGDARWGQAIAESRDLNEWTTVAEIEPVGDVEAKGICAGGAVVIDDRVHLFYQTYGNARQDAICHATSDDGIHFERAAYNPLFRPIGDWNCGRAIDAEARVIGDEVFCYWATRDPAYKVQMIGVHSAPRGDLVARAWHQRCDASILKPELPWERDCIEAPTVCTRPDGTHVMFYAGGYNNAPQQIGVAFSTDGLRWERMSDQPFLANGAPGEWNHSESGHPGIFVDAPEHGGDGSTWLFFQGNDDGGKTWFLSKRKIEWDGHVPRLA